MRSGDRAAAATTVELVAGVAALAAELAARPAPESGAACYEQAEALGRAVDVLESAIADRVAIASRTGVVAEWGHTSPTAWLRTTLGMRHTRAEERAVLAAQLPRLPQVTKRLATGDLSAGYAAAIATGVRRLDESDCGKAEHLLLDFVDQGHSVGQITRFADKIKDLIAERDDETAAEPEDGRRAERQWLAIHRSGTGSFVKGRFGAELTALVKAKLEPLAKPCGPDDRRDHAERLADALHTHLSNGDSRWDPILIINLKQPLWRSPAGDAESDLAAVSAPGRTQETGPPATVADGALDRHDPAAANKTPRAGNPTRTSAPCPTRRAGSETVAANNTLDPRESTAASRARQASNPALADAPDRRAGAGEEVATRDALVRRESTAGFGRSREPDPARAVRSSAAGSSGVKSDELWVLRPPAPGWPFDGTPFTARLADGTPIPTDRARQILLNAGFSTLVLGTDGHPLYLGRRVRCATPAQRRALLARYPTCVVNGCEIPATACQIDHADGWENGQPSDIDQLVMCCAFHNKYKWRHPDRITITQHNGRYQYQITRPGNHQHDRRCDRPTGGPSERGP